MEAFRVVSAGKNGCNMKLYHISEGIEISATIKDLKNKGREA